MILDRKRFVRARSFGNRVFARNLEFREQPTKRLQYCRHRARHLSGEYDLWYVWSSRVTRKLLYSAPLLMRGYWSCMYIFIFPHTIENNAAEGHQLFQLLSKIITTTYYSWGNYMCAQYLSTIFWYTIICSILRFTTNSVENGEQTKLGAFFRK